MGCRRVASAAELVRLVRTADSGVALGRGMPGRGAWLCAGSLVCAERAARRGQLARALRGELRPDVLEELRALIVGDS